MSQKIQSQSQSEKIKIAEEKWLRETEGDINAMLDLIGQEIPEILKAIREPACPISASERSLLKGSLQHAHESLLALLAATSGFDKADVRESIAEIRQA